MVAVAVGLVAACVAIVHARRLVQAATRRHTLLLPVEAGHVVLAAGMATMFLAPRVGSGVAFVWIYLVAALVFLGFAAGRRECCDAPFWSCYSMLAVESFAMAAVVGAAHGWTDHLTALFVTVFASAGVVGAARLVVPRFVPRFVPAFAGGGSLTPAASRVVMSGVMLLMFL